MTEIVHGNFFVKIIRSHRKSLALEVHDGLIKVRAPKKVSEEHIIDFVSQKSAWIRKQLEKYANSSVPPPWRESGKVLVEGTPLVVTVQNDLKSRRKTLVQRNKEELIVKINRNTQVDDKIIQDALSLHLKNLAMQVLPRRTYDYANHLNVSPTKVSVRYYKTRWGATFPSGEIRYNWRLIMAPPNVIDYVVIHEVAHLIEFNHSKKFWTIVDNLVEDRYELIQWLKINGPSLTLS